MRIFLINWFAILFILIGLVASALPGNSLAQKVSNGVFNPETTTLSNGMRVVVIRNHRVPVVTHMVWYSVGSADEGIGESGIAHFLEHLMFKGTKKYAPGEFSRILARNGGQENAFTSSDYTAYFQTIAVDRLEMFMEMEADRMTNLVLTEKGVKTEKAVVMEERRSRTDNDPGERLAEQVNAALYLNHPYRRPVIGWAHEIEALSLKQVMAFYKKWYHPSNAILVVGGDITLEKLKPLAEKYYGSIAISKPNSRMRPIEPSQTAKRRVTLEDKRVQQPAWGRVYIAPGHLSKDKKHAYALEILANIIGQGTTSILFQKLVVEDKIAVGAGSYYQGKRHGPGTFSLYASPLKGIKMKTLENNIENILKNILRNGIDPKEVERAKKRLRSKAIYARDSITTGARVIGAALAVGLTIDHVEKWPDHIGDVTTKEVNAAAKAVLNPSNSVTSILLKKKTD
jgi:zinc protease